MFDPTTVPALEIILICQAGFNGLLIIGVCIIFWLLSRNKKELDNHILREVEIQNQMEHCKVRLENRMDVLLTRVIEAEMKVITTIENLQTEFANTKEHFTSYTKTTSQ